MPTLRVLLALTGRDLRTCARQPSLTISPLLMSAFFLVIYNGQLAGIGELITGGGRYIDVVLPLCLLTTAFTGGATAGQLIVRDIDSGYRTRLTITPVRRLALVLPPVFAGGVVLAVQAAVLLAVAAVLGLRPRGGALSWLVLVASTVAVGGGFLLLAVAAAIGARTAGAVSAVTLVFFPLSFLTATLVPRERLAGWMAVAADLNPLTYPLQAMRSVVAATWHDPAMIRGGVATTVLLVAGIAAVVAATTYQHRKGA